VSTFQSLVTWSSIRYETMSFHPQFGAKLLPFRHRCMNYNLCNTSKCIAFLFGLNINASQSIRTESMHSMFNMEGCLRLSEWINACFTRTRWRMNEWIDATVNRWMTEQCIGSMSGMSKLVGKRASHRLNKYVYK